VTGCPAPTPVNASSEKRIDVAARGSGSYLIIAGFYVYFIVYTIHTDLNLKV